MPQSSWGTDSWSAYCPSLLLTFGTEAGSQEAEPGPGPGACRLTGRGWAIADCCRRSRSHFHQNRSSPTQPQKALKSCQQKLKGELNIFFMLFICCDNLVWSVNRFTLTCLHLLSAPAPSEERPEPVTCVWESVCQSIASMWGWEQRGPILTSSVIMVGHSEVRCWGDIRRSSTLKNRNTWAWRMGTWGRRRLSTRRSEHRVTHFSFSRDDYIFEKLVSDEHVCVCVCVCVGKLPCMSGRYFWYWSTSLL